MKKEKKYEFCRKIISKKQAQSGQKRYNMRVYNLQAKIQIYLLFIYFIITFCFSTCQNIQGKHLYFIIC